MTTTSVVPGALAAGSSVEETRKNIAPALGRVPSGVYIVTLRHNGDRHGLMATWVAQAGFNPPKVTLAFNKERPILSSIRTGSFVTINVLSGKNMEIFKKFAGPGKEGVDRFSDLPLADAKTASSPVFSEAVSFLDCKVEAFLDAGDHVVVLAEVVNGALLNEEQPMTHVRKDGFKY